MALWGKTDDLASKPKWITRKAVFDGSAVNTTTERINLLASNTGFSTGDAVQYNHDGTAITNVATETDYYVRVVGTALIELYNTYANAIAASGTTGRVNLAGSPAGYQQLQRTGAANPFGDHINNGHNIIFVDDLEALVEENKARGITGAGWWSYRTYTDAQSVTRHKAECLIAMSVFPMESGDAEDTIAVDLEWDYTEPTNQTAYEEAEPNIATFTVLPVTTNIAANATSFQWQKSDNDGDDWYDIVGATGSSYTTGALTVADDNGDLYRCVMGFGEVQGIVSDSATLTVYID